MNIFLKGSAVEDLGKPTITLMVDGSLSKARAFYLSYSPASSTSVLMCLRDYVRRNNRLPKILVLDNGKEFHSHALLLFCSLFGITIRWRRASHPRDSTIVERMLGVTEKEIIQQLDGNSIAMKDPRMVSSTHHPDKHIRWTLPALHGVFEYFLFDVHCKRIHPRFGMSPDDREKRQLPEYGSRSHVVVRYDQTLKLLTAPHCGPATRVIDRKRGVYADGMWYWHDRLALAEKGEECEVRTELWRMRILYVCFRGNWYVAQARDGGRRKAGTAGSLSCSCARRTARGRRMRRRTRTPLRTHKSANGCGETRPNGTSACATNSPRPTTSTKSSAWPKSCQRPRTRWAASSTSALVRAVSSTCSTQCRASRASMWHARLSRRRLKQTLPQTATRSPRRSS
ncbi:DDE-type integrase/transposase/recombinase [Ramlibacter terrae]|uniref:DDE-type integrase/transposase/recombinase n=1 Tax=Ramlibacter terrae TaxID=2732511 RepID=A0ABX6P866_9BURK|nr:DDE-type integrase/transposase/recombinase [Ramlibacter terrae]